VEQSRAAQPGNPADVLKPPLILSSDISSEEYRREKSMKINIVYKEEKGWFVGHIQDAPIMKAKERLWRN
jgi:hypothetical protein